MLPIYWHVGASKSIIAPICIVYSSNINMFIHSTYSFNNLQIH